MSNTTRQPAALEFKPDLLETNRRWEAYWAGEMMDRPIVCCTVPKEGAEYVSGSTYRERVYGDLGDILDRALINGEQTFYGGESVPSFWTSFGCDEIAAFCGGELFWSSADADTNWSKPFVEHWEDSLPLRLIEDHPLWLRMLEFYELGAERLGGKMLLNSIDLHSNMDLVAAARGFERLCIDLVDDPDLIDRAMADARAVFPRIWQDISEAARMPEFGYAHGGYSMDGVAVLQCDFSALISPDMFARWVRPALEEEAEIVRHAVYHWDGPRALIYFDELMSMDGLHTFAFVPDPGETHMDYLDLYQRVQGKGKAVSVGGSVDEVKQMHRVLKPHKTIYHTGVSCRRELDELLGWFVANT